MDIIPPMLDFLVTSKTRRRLLKLLWGTEESGSASQFAKLARVGFASAYRELRAMQALGLVVTERKGGAEVYRANSSHPLADTLHNLVVAPVRSTEDQEVQRLRGQLKALGAPLRAQSEEYTGTLEETVVRGVSLAHRDPDVARTLPLCLYRQRHVLRADRLRYHALQLGEKRALGFFLDLTAALSGDNDLAKWTKLLRDRRCTASLDFFHNGSRSRLQRQIADDNTPLVARQWGFRMNMDMDTFRSTFEKFAHVA